MRKASGTDVSYVGGDLSSAGTLEAQTGVLELRGSGTMTGPASVSANATLRTAMSTGETMLFDTGSSVTGVSGTLDINGGTTDFASGVTVDVDTAELGEQRLVQHF